MAYFATNSSFFVNGKIILWGVSVSVSSFLHAATLAQTDADLMSSVSLNKADVTINSSLEGNDFEADSSLSDIRIIFLTLPSVEEQYTPYELDQELLELLAQTNSVFANSLVNAKVSLAYVGSWTLGTEDWLQSATAEQMYQAMNATVSDGYWGDGKLAQQYSADVIFLLDSWSSGDAYCGWASIGTESDLMHKETTSSFGVIRLGPGCGINAFSVTHEIGHLLGAAHALDDSLSASSPFGYGIACGESYTVMHQSYPKTPYFSSAELQQEGVSCGSFELQDNARLFNARTKLLADKNSENEIKVHLVDQIRQQVDASSDSVRVTLFRAGDLSESSSFRWDYSYLYSSQKSSLQGGEVVFDAGQSSAEIETNLTWGMINRDEKFEIYFKNPLNIKLMKTTVSLKVNDEGIVSAPIANFSVEVIGARVKLVDRTDSEFEIIETHWDLGDGQEVFNQNQFDYEYQSESDFPVTLSVVDEYGSTDSMTVVVNAKIAAEPSSSPPSAAEPSDGSEGGALSFYWFVLFIVANRFKKKFGV